MALIDTESFALASSNTDLFNFGVIWNVLGGVTQNGDVLGDTYITPTSVISQSLHNLPGGYGTFFFGCRFYQGVSGTSPQGVIYFNDQFGTEQFHLITTIYGAIFVYRGATLLGTAWNAFVPNIWNYLEVGAVIGTGTSGSITLRINGNTVLTLSGINSQNSAASSLVAQYGFQLVNASGSNFYSNIYFCDNTGAAPWNTFLGETRILARWPTGNNSVQFTPVTSAPDIANGIAASASGASVTANTVRFNRIQVTRGGQVTAVRLYWFAAYTGHWKLAIYSDNGSAPNAGNAPNPASILYQSAEQTNSVAGFNSISVAGGPTLTPGYYWVAVLLDANGTSVMGSSTTTGSNNPFQSYTATYASGFPTSLGTASNSATMDFVAVAISTANNYQNIYGIPPANPAVLYNADNVSGHQDSFNMTPGVPSTATVYAINVRSLAYRVDAGPRTLNNLVISGATRGDGAAFGPASFSPASYNSVQHKDIFTLDPATGAAWTATAANAAKIGYRIAS